MSTTVSVRMYRQGFGDCFLLTLQDEGADPHYVLIDCGVQTGAPSVMPAVLAHIKKTTNHLDAVVVTHDHADHVTGFANAAKKFDGVQIDKLWLAWTEDDTDPVAKAIKKARGVKLAALGALAAGAHTAGLTAPPQIRTTLEFAGWAPGARAAAKLDPVLPPNTGMKDITALFAAEDITYCKPGREPLTIPGVKGARFFVLGPPWKADPFLLPKPTDADAVEIYSLAAAAGADASFLSAAVAAVGAGVQGDSWDEASELSFPFDKTHRLPLVVKKGKISAPATGPQAAFLRAHYCGHGDEWRRIDSDWLATAGQLAMRIDLDTNLTSLVLALELIESGKVLLFPGDAQIESWVTWADCSTEIKEDGRKVKRTGEELLGKVVFYKVGHHGSHNGTAKKHGLEFMLRDDIVAMIPTDPKYWEVVQQETTGWHMPEKHVLAAVRDKTHRRVVQANRGDANVLSEGADPAFLKKLTVDSLYIEYVVSD